MHQVATIETRRRRLPLRFHRRCRERWPDRLLSHQSAKLRQAKPRDRWWRSPNGLRHPLSDKRIRRTHTHGCRLRKMRESALRIRASWAPQRSPPREAPLRCSPASSPGPPSGKPALSPFGHRASPPAHTRPACRVRTPLPPAPDPGPSCRHAANRGPVGPARAAAPE